MRKVIRVEGKLRAMIDEANSIIDRPDSAQLARYLAERGVTVAPLSVEIGTPVYVIRVKSEDSFFGKHDNIVNSIHYLQHCACDRDKAEFRIVEKPATKTDGAKLGKFVFLTEEEAEAKLKEYIADFQEG